MAIKKNPSLPEGSWVYRNWNAARSSMPENYAEEIPLYSDARFVGELHSELAPYVVLNPIPEPYEPGTLVPALVVRLSAHLEDDMQSVEEAFKSGIPDTTAFVGGSVYDELASLLSLAHGARLAPGPTIRCFHRGNTDSRGSPCYSQRGVPVLPSGQSEKVIPTLRNGAIQLRPDLIEKYPSLPWETAREIARAASSYRQAIWVANGDGNLAWLRLVSAAETAANEWARLQNANLGSGEELLKAIKPEYAARLRAVSGACADAVLETVAAEQANVLRAQRKFMEFLLTFVPNPPSPRPKAFFADWSPDGLRKSLEVVYTYRSASLHASTPFPLPMCGGPRSEDDAGIRAWAEKPSGATYHNGGLWTDKQLPLNLHAFHHLVRGALLRWWATLGADQDVHAAFAAPATW